MERKVVYGVFTNIGDGKEHLWHLGVCLTEEEAQTKFWDYIKNDEDSWIDEIKVL